MSPAATRKKLLRLSAEGDEMNQRSETLSQPELVARKRREARERKPVREGTAEERREAFSKAREAERYKSRGWRFGRMGPVRRRQRKPRERGTFWCRQ